MFKRLSIASRITAMNLVALCALALVLVLVIHRLVSTEMERQILEKQESSNKIAWQVLEGAGAGFRVEGDKLFVGDTLLNGNDAIVDRIQSIAGGGVATIFLGDTRIATNVMKPDGSGRAVGTKLARNEAYQAVLGEGKSFRGKVEILGEPYYTVYDPIKDKSGTTIGMVLVGVREADFFSLVNHLLFGASIAALICFAFLGAVAFGATRILLKPLNTVRTVLEAIGAGHRDTEVPYLDRKDEVGAMAHSVQVFKESLLEAEALKKANDEARGRAEADRRRAMQELAAHFEETVGAIANAVSASASDLQATAGAMAETTREASQQSVAVSAASEQTTQNVETVAAASEELSSSIQEINNQVSESTRIVASAVAEADQANAKVAGLSEAAKKIGAVAQLISDIASQTNLLALNATIEAARAGDAGKGFAVVASEVKNLAVQTAKATDEIAQQIRSIQDATDGTVEAIGSIGGIIARVSEISTAIASAVEEQGAATQEISRSVQQAAQGTGEVSTNITGVTNAIQSAGGAAGLVLEAAAKLSSNGDSLREQVDRFLREVREEAPHPAQAASA